MTPSASLSLRSRLHGVNLVLTFAYAATILLWVWWFAPRTSLFAELSLERTRLLLLSRPHGPVSSWDHILRVPGLRASYVDRTGQSIVLAGQPVPGRLPLQRVWTRRIRVTLPGLPGPLLLEQQAPPGMALLLDRDTLGRLGVFCALLLAFGTLAVAYAERLLASQLGVIPEALQQVGAGQWDTRLPVTGDPDMRPVVEAVNRMTERLQATEHHLQAAVQAVAAARQHKAQMLSTISHDLRTPVTVLLARGDQPHGVSAAAASMLERLDRILEWSRLEAGALVPHWEEFEAEEVLEQALSRAGRLVHVRLEGGEPGRLIFSDFRWLARALESVCARLAVERVALSYQPASLECRLHGAQTWNPGETPLQAWLSPEECNQVFDTLQIRVHWEPMACLIRIPCL